MQIKIKNKEIAETVSKLVDMGIANYGWGGFSVIAQFSLLDKTTSEMSMEMGLLDKTETKEIRNVLVNRKSLKIEEQFEEQEKIKRISVMDEKTAKIRNFVFIEAFKRMQESIHANAKDKGWWDEPRTNGEIIALIHSELSEALEGMRHGNPPDQHLPELSSVEVELADAIIRIMDYAQVGNLKVAEALIAKMQYNKNRPHKHGKLF